MRTKGKDIAIVVVLSLVLMYLVMNFVDLLKITSLVLEAVRYFLNVALKAAIMIIILVFSFESTQRLLQSKDIVSLLSVLCVVALALSTLFPSRPSILLEVYGAKLGLSQLYFIALAVFTHLIEITELQKKKKKQNRRIANVNSSIRLLAGS